MSVTAMGKQSAYEKLSLKEKIGYGMGDAGSCMIWSVLALYLTWFYTDVYGLNPAIVGTLFLVIRVFDAFSDPIMGAICDRTKSRWGKFRPWLLWMALPFGLGAALMFTTPDLSMNGKIIYAWITYLIMSLIYTAINIPYCSVAGVITLNQKERMGCLSWRFFLNGLATLIVSSTILPLTDWLGNGNRASGFQMTMIIMGAAATLMFLFCFASIKERVASVKANDSLMRDLKDIVKNDQWLLMISITFLNVFPAFIRGAVTIYYASYVMHASVGFITFFMALGVACNMLGSVIAKPLTDRFDKVKLFRIINVILGFLSFALWFVDPASLTPLLTLFIIINILHLIQSGPILWAMMSDVDDYGDWKFGKRLTGISFAGNLFMLKMGLAVAGAIVAWVLSYTGYIANKPDQNPQTVQGIIIMFSLLPMVCYFISAFMARYFKLNNTFLEKIKVDLAKRELENGHHEPQEHNRAPTTQPAS
ncbi:TPA: glycoside-pentoside-hexuronide (GPH):cation symporter [Escherichia coli]|uniref:glycoside-pentoside-hexuronide (GPH):cation symporter n=1 Tax=Escherichia coli TaxID=562 RepID=UPI0007611EA6|nr:MFS transporter [Escherichia coli]EIS6815697.1 MFS transporter [Escherichia coli]EKV4606763.1 MFS transporter [Escherichia coli]EKY0872493.1 MFS transporter [Escherichia coli]ELJ9822251.1 MFS transporter [Escherichia coli]MBJ0142742.1 MFS transporter [Escherichia coli]